RSSGLANESNRQLPEARRLVDHHAAERQRALQIRRHGRDHHGRKSALSEKDVSDDDYGAAKPGSEPFWLASLLLNPFDVEQGIACRPSAQLAVLVNEIWISSIVRRCDVRP